MNEKKDKLQMIKEKTGFAMKVAKTVAKDVELKKSVKEAWKGLKELAEGLDVNKY